MKFKRKTDPIAGQVLQQERIDERQIFSRNDAFPANLDRVFREPIQVWIGQPERGHESTIGIADKHFRLPAADLELIAVKKTAIVVVQAESVSRGQRNGAIGLTQEKQISVLDDERFGDVAFNGMNLWDEIRIFLSSNGVARSGEDLPMFSHDSGEEINILLEMRALQICAKKRA